MYILKMISDKFTMIRKNKIIFVIKSSNLLFCQRDMMMEKRTIRMNQLVHGYSVGHWEGFCFKHYIYNIYISIREFAYSEFIFVYL